MVDLSAESAETVAALRRTPSSILGSSRHKLQDKDNGRKIIPDTKLATLLKLKKTDELTYFNLQKYMSPHFAKAVKAEVAAVATV